MNLLKDMKCQACRQDSHRVTEQEIKELQPQLPEWAWVEGHRWTGAGEDVGSHAQLARPPPCAHH